MRVQLRIALYACTLGCYHTQRQIESLWSASAFSATRGTSGLDTRGSPQCVNIAGLMCWLLPAHTHKTRLADCIVDCLPLE